MLGRSGPYACEISTRWTHWKGRSAGHVSTTSCMLFFLSPATPSSLTLKWFFFGRMVHGHRKQLKVSSTRLALLHTRTSSSRFRSGCLEKPTSIWRVWKLKMELPTDIWMAMQMEGKMGLLMAISKKSLSALPHLSWLGAWLPAYSVSRLFWNFYINSYVTLCDCSRPSNRP